MQGSLFRLPRAVHANRLTIRAAIWVRSRLLALESSLIAERVHAGLRNARARAKRLGRPRMIVDRARIGRLRAEGLSWVSIAAQRSAAGSGRRNCVPAGKDIRQKPHRGRAHKSLCCSSRLSAFPSAKIRCFLGTRRVFRLGNPLGLQFPPLLLSFHCWLRKDSAFFSRSLSSGNGRA